MIVCLFRNFYTLTKISESLYPFAIIVSLGTSLTLTCFRKIARTYPKNYILLGIFTFCEAILVENFLAYYDS